LITLLLVEDELLILDYARDALESGGYKVITASDGHSAMEIINQRAQDLSGIVTDIRLPGSLNGWGIAHRAR
jgi:CheY-like chemotaxis protein